MPKYRLIKDKHAKGGQSAFLLIACAACQTPILLYQKDGPGGLLRLFLDRIHAPQSLADLHHTCAAKADMPGLTCPDCGAVLGVPMVYKGGRLAFRLIRGRVIKTKNKGIFPA